MIQWKYGIKQWVLSIKQHKNTLFQGGASEAVVSEIEGDKHERRIDSEEVHAENHGAREYLPRLRQQVS